MAAPLKIYVVWHPDYANGLQYFKAIYALLNSNPDKPIARKLRIPVEQRNLKPLFDSQNEITTLMGIDVESAEKHLVVALIDRTMVDDNQENQQWKRYLDDLLNLNNEKVKLLTVAIDSDDAFSVDPTGKNSVRLYEKTGNDNNSIEYPFAYLQLRLLHIIWGWLLGIRHPRIKFFLSHTKHEPSKRAEKIAKKIRNFLLTNTTFRAFIDENDIEVAENFWEVIQDEMQDDTTALIIIDSDNFSSRTVCVSEVLLAKKKDKPNDVMT